VENKAICTSNIDTETLTPDKSMALSDEITRCVKTTLPLIGNSGRPDCSSTLQIAETFTSYAMCLAVCAIFVIHVQVEWSSVINGVRPNTLQYNGHFNITR